MSNSPDILGCHSLGAASAAQIRRVLSYLLRTATVPDG